MRKLVLSIAALFILVILISCTAQRTVKELKVDKPNLSMETGTSDTLTVTISPVDAKNPDIEWLSSDEKIATVDNIGLVKAISIGRATITAKTKNGKLSVTSSVIVKAKSVKGIKLNKDSVTIEVRLNDKLETSIEPPDAGNQKVTWESSNTKVAIVDENGTIKGVAAGTADITVRTEDGGFTAKCLVTITEKVQPSAGSNTNKSSNTKNSNANSIPQEPFKVTILSPKPNSTVKIEPLVLSWTMKNKTTDLDEYYIELHDLIPWVQGYTGFNEPSGTYHEDLTGKVNPLFPKPNEANGISSYTIPVSRGNFALKKGHKYKLLFSASLSPSKNHELPDGRTPYKSQLFIVEFTVEGKLDYPY